MVIITLVSRCGACSVVYPDFQVGSTFRVRVEDHGRPVERLRVEIGSNLDNGSRLVTETDKNGFALFRGVRPGSYHVSAYNDAGIPDGADLEVKLDGPTNVTVPLKWPGMAPILVRSLKGTIRGPDYLPGQPQPGISLDILEGRSGRNRKTLRTNDSGEFDLEGAPSGLYFLNLKPSGLVDSSGEPITGLIAVAVDRSAAQDRLDLDLEWSSCGLSYAESSNCPQSGDLQAASLSGQVVDEVGAVIPRAKVILLDNAGVLVDQVQSDNEGRFALPRSLAGTYELVVTSGGFTPFRRTVRAEPNGEQARPLPLTVQLGVLGGCSGAKLQ
jgi:hypothetical protein